MDKRLQLQTLLEELLGSGNVYFQPPESTKMDYPAIVYNRDYQSVFFADNTPYHRRLRYQVTVIDRNPDSLIPDRVAELPLTTLVRHFTLDQLNHDIYDVYF